jgi:hypothetical protein
MTELLVADSTPEVIPARLQAVNVYYPAGGSVPAGTISSYGGFSYPDTTVIRVELLQNGQVVQTNSSPKIGGSAWLAPFTNVGVGTDYAIRVVGNVNTTTGGTFSVV